MQIFSKEDLLKPPEKTAAKAALTVLCYVFFVAGVAAAAWGFLMAPRPSIAGQYSPQLLISITGAMWAFFWGAGILYAASMRDGAERERLILLEDGRFGKARILYTERDADVPGADMAVEMFLEVQIADQAPFHIKERIVVSIDKLSQFKEGEVLDVLIAPEVSGVRGRVVKFLYE